MSEELTPPEKLCLETDCKELEEIKKKCIFYKRYKDTYFLCPKCGALIPALWIDTAYYHQFKCGTMLRIVKKYKVKELKIEFR